MVTIVHREPDGGETRTQVEAQIQAELGFFDVDAPIYDGDTVLATDPRGGERELYVKRVNIYNARGISGMANMAHIEAMWGAAPSSAPRSGAGGATTITITGDNAQVAVGSETVTQTTISGTVAGGYEDFAKLIADIINGAGKLPESPERETLLAESKAVATQLTGEPTPSLISRSAIVIKSLFASILSGAGRGLSDETADWVHHVVDQLGQHIS